MGNFFELMVDALREGEPFALGIISGIKGSSPQKRGAKALFFADGRIVGTLGGGCLEAEIREQARQALRDRTPAVFDLVLDHDFGWDDGLICGGKVNGLILPHASAAADIWRELAARTETRTWGVRHDYTVAWIDTGIGAGDEWLYEETVRPPCALWIAGSGHVAQALTPVAQLLDFEVTVMDDRPLLANHQNFPAATRLRVDAWEKLLMEPLPLRPVFGVIVTRGHQHDALVLRSWIRQPFAYLGMVGSRRKRRLILTEFQEEGIATAEELGRVECPVGLAIDAVTVPEIAISIAARLVQRRAHLGDPAIQGG